MELALGVGDVAVRGDDGEARAVGYGRAEADVAALDAAFRRLRRRALADRLAGFRRGPARPTAKPSQ